jgi:LSD1 subclass zinc finger protein
MQSPKTADAAGVSTPQQQHQFPCEQCGALLTYAPGSDSLKCPYCGAQNQIDASKQPVGELDYNAYLAQLAAGADTVETLPVKCGGCGAASTLPPGMASGACPFCGQPVVAEAMSVRQIKPEALLPFAIKRDQAQQAFRQWLSSLWFAPSELAACAEKGKIDGCYVPAWTYDCDTVSQYVGERGEDYTETENYTEVVNGQTVERTREVIKTRWWPASGVVQDQFDDVLVLASNSLPPTCRDHLEPWDLKSLVPYRDEFLSGFVTEMYQVDLPAGFEAAKGIMAGTIRQTVESDIGGNHQRIFSIDTDYRDITFKHILLPLWISAYSLRGKTYRFLVNARTGKVAGERPYSAWKITAAIAAGLVVILLILWLKSR